MVTMRASAAVSSTRPRAMRSTTWRRVGMMRGRRAPIERPNALIARRRPRLQYQMLRAAVVVMLAGAATAVGAPADSGRFAGEPFAPEPFAFEVFTRQQGAPENSFYALAPDRHGRIALGMING